MARLLYSKSHEWASVEGDIATIGITSHAQRQLGDIVFVELPLAGSAFVQFTQFGTIESTKAASELYIPLSGEIIEVNSELSNNPQWVNEDPLGKGWMIKIKIQDPSETGNLLDEAAYKALTETQV